MSDKENGYLTAYDIMLDKIVFVKGIDTALEALKLMKREDTDALIIEKRSPEDAYGILVSGDLLNQVLIPNKNPEEVSVYEIMSKPVISIPSNLNIRYIPRLMKRANIRIAPVEKEGKLIGMISIKEVINQFLESHK